MIHPRLVDHNVQRRYVFNKRAADTDQDAIMFKHVVEHHRHERSLEHDRWLDRLHLDLKSALEGVSLPAPFWSIT
jgi:hypothetical protein